MDSSKKRKTIDRINRHYEMGDDWKSAPSSKASREITDFVKEVKKLAGN